MPNIQLEPFFVDDLALAWVDKLRDRMSREEFFRRMMQAGLCNALEELARTTRDHAALEMSQATGGFQQGRGLLVIEAAKELESKA